ncbi:hypothetical protein [Ensifer sp. BR816]|nr:hypothetical protein [Ensifer sp. BR816]
MIAENRCLVELPDDVPHRIGVSFFQDAPSKAALVFSFEQAE